MEGSGGGAEIPHRKKSARTFVADSTTSYNTLTTSMHHFFRLLGFLDLALPSRVWSFAPSLAGSYCRKGLAVLRLRSLAGGAAAGDGAGDREGERKGDATGAGSGAGAGAAAGAAVRSAARVAAGSAAVSAATFAASSPARSGARSAAGASHP